MMDIRNLTTELETDNALVRAVDALSLTIARGQTFALVGESGCGKSMTALSLLRLLPDNGRVTGGQVDLDGTDVLALPESRMREFRGRKISMIFQEPATSLNPVMTVGRQIREVIERHTALRGEASAAKAVDWLRRVGLDAPERRAQGYSFQLSGGQKQRVMIAIALACQPELLIADEPTTALDVTVQAEIIDLMTELCAARGTAILMISHDLGLVSNMCQRVAVMYAGRIVEMQPAEAIFATPSHPYTKGLVDSLPRLGERARRGRQRLREISGVVPSITTYPPGCRFNPRCPSVTEICRSVSPEVTVLGDGGFVRCHHHG